MNFIKVTPLVIEVATNTEAVATVTGHSDNVTPAKSGFLSEWFEYPGGSYTLNEVLTNITKNGDSATDRVDATFTILNNQPFSVYLQTAGYLHLHSDFRWGFKTDLGKETAINFSGTPSGWGWSIDFEGLVAIAPQPIPTAAVNSWNISSDGITLTVTKEGIIVFTAPMPLAISALALFFEMRVSGNIMHNVHITTASIEEPVNAHTCGISFLPNEDFITTRLISETKLGIKPIATEDRVMVVTHPSVTESLMIPIHVRDMFLRPITPVTVVQELDIITFESNAIGGFLSATSGVVVDQERLQWQAIGAGQVTLTYTLGEMTAIYQLLIIPRIQIEGVVDGYYSLPLIQGEQIILYPTIDGTFACVNYPNVISESGTLVVPTEADNEVFGKKDLDISFTAFGITVSFIVEVLPMYPTPQFNGVMHKQWLQKRRDYLPTTKKTVGGRKESRNENENGVIMWELEYEILTAKACTCGENNCAHRFNAARLDAFYNLVRLTDYFSLVDYFTKEVFRFVTIESYDNTHEFYRNEQARSITLYFDGGDIQL